MRSALSFAAACSGAEGTVGGRANGGETYGRRNDSMRGMKLDWFWKRKAWPASG